MRKPFRKEEAFKKKSSNFIVLLCKIWEYLYLFELKL